jgi:hypothetical protein
MKINVRGLGSVQGSALVALCLASLCVDAHYIVLSKSVCGCTLHPLTSIDHYTSFLHISSVTQRSLISS